MITNHELVSQKAMPSKKLIETISFHDAIIPALNLFQHIGQYYHHHIHRLYALRVHIQELSHRHGVLQVKKTEKKYVISVKLSF